MEHARLSPSSAHRWMACPGSVGLCEKLPRTTNEAARIGTGAHALIEQTQINPGRPAFEVPQARIGEILDFEFDRQPSQLVITAEMVQHCNLYLTRLKEHIDSNSEVFMEMEIDLTHIHPKTFGHADNVVSKMRKGKLIVADFKYGFIAVELVGNPDALIFFDYDQADINPQLLIYACGTAHKDLWLYSDITMDIIQPRCTEVAPVQTVTVPAKWLHHWQENTLRNAVRAALDPLAPLIPGKHCRFCPAAAPPAPFEGCPALAQQIIDTAHLDFAEFQTGEVSMAHFDWSKENIERVLHWSPVWISFLKGIHARALQMAKNGETFQGFKLAKGRAGNRKWPHENDSETLVELVVNGGLTQDDLQQVWEQTRSLLSPAQMEKLGPQFKAAVKAVAQRGSEGKEALVSVNSIRSKIETTNDFEEFANESSDS